MSSQRRLADVLDQIDSLITNHVSLSHQSIATLIALWIVQTYCFDLFEYCGYLAVRSATPQCGKTRLFKLIAPLCNGSPPVTTVTTAPVLFRSTRAVIILDEVDKLRNEDREASGAIMAVLNAGFEKGGIVERLERTEGQKYKVVQFPVYGPKALAGIESLTDTIADRAFNIYLKRSPIRMPRLRKNHLESHASRIRDALSFWVQAHRDELQNYYEDLPDELAALSKHDDRFQDIVEPLLVLAVFADHERPEGPVVLTRFLEGLNAIAPLRKRSDRERELLAFLEIIEMRLGPGTSAFMRSAELFAACQKQEELQSIKSPKGLACFLSNFALYPRESPDGRSRGYWITREWLSEWRAGYSPGTIR